jgi:hypothetical protein
MPVSGVPRLVVIVGARGSGKTWLAEALAASLGLVAVKDRAPQFTADHHPPRTQADFAAVARMMYEAIGTSLAGATHWHMSHVIADTAPLQWQVASDLATGGHDRWFRNHGLPVQACLILDNQVGGHPGCAAFRTALALAARRAGYPVFDVTGTGPDRLASALDAIARMEP